jgi:L-fuconate dehydratase
MNPDPDYSVAYAIVHTDDVSLTGHGFTFTIGRGNEVCVAAIEALRPLLVGRSLEETFADMGGFWRSVTGDSQLRWIGPRRARSTWRPPRS